MTKHVFGFFLLRSASFAGQVGISGSARLGDCVTLGGAVGLVDHVEIGANAMVGAFSLVTKDVPPGQMVWGIPARPAMAAKRESAAVRRLPGLLKTLRARDRAGTKDQPETETQNGGD